MVEAESWCGPSALRREGTRVGLGVVEESGTGGITGPGVVGIDVAGVMDGQPAHMRAGLGRRGRCLRPTRNVTHNAGEPGAGGPPIIVGGGGTAGPIVLCGTPLGVVGRATTGSAFGRATTNVVRKR